MLDGIDNQRNVLLCVGPGGVGKTTTSAALGLAAARSGKKVLVLTIDPARRLADAMGIGLNNELRRIDLDDTSLRVAGGELWATMLDPVETMDGLVRRIAPSASVAEEIIDNRVYRQISRALSGALEYTAVEKLYQLHTSGKFDLIVVDTPPSKNVLDFLDAPGWLSRFFDRRIIRWFLLSDPTVKRRGIAGRLLQTTSKTVWQVLSRLLGQDLLDEILRFLRHIESIADAFRERGLALERILRAPTTGFLVVTTAESFVLRDALFLKDTISKRGVPFAGFVVNKVAHTIPDAQIQEGLEVLEDAMPVAERGAVLTHLCALAQRERDDVARDNVAIDRLRREAHWGGWLTTVPRVAGDITDLSGLTGLAEGLKVRPAGAEANRT